MTMIEPPPASPESVAPAASRERRFPDPYEIATPAGAEGWRELYPYFNLFSEARKAQDGSRTWFLNGMHFPEPLPPFDVLTADAAFMSTGVMNSRVFALPPALGLDVRIVNGYMYMSANSVTDEAEQARRAEEFGVRAGHYYRNWDSLYAQWETKMRDSIAALRSVEIPELGDFEPVETVLAGRGVSSAVDLITAYHRIVESAGSVWNLHSEFLNLGYAAYLNFLTICRGHFPEITDQSVAKMVSGVDLVLFEPDEALKKLARRAVELGLADAVRQGESFEALSKRLEETEAGRSWLADFEKAKDPWFNFSYGNGFYHHHRSWIDDLTFPLKSIAEYVGRLLAGEDLRRPTEEVAAERDLTVDRYRTLIDEDDVAEFDEALGLARTVFPYVENHNFYVEHWYMTVFWNKMRELGDLLVRFGFFPETDDVFFLRHPEVHDALVDLQMAWAGGGEPQGPTHWPAIVAERRRVHAVLRAWTPPPALGPAPTGIVEPMTIMLWGITDAQVEKWLDAQEDGDGARSLSGFAGSPGIAEGRARVVLGIDDLDLIEEGEILVAPITSPSWTPVFAKIRGAVSDIGGIMCHAAIVSREYGLPAVVGTGMATSMIRTGQLIRVDGDNGTVMLLDDPEGEQ